MSLLTMSGNSTTASALRVPVPKSKVSTQNPNDDSKYRSPAYIAGHFCALIGRKTSQLS